MDHKRKERDFDSHGEDVVNATLSRLRAQSAPREDVETPAQVLVALHGKIAQYMQ